MEQEKNKLIQFRHIVKEFDGQVVLKGIDLDIYENEFVTLLGPSGCGKTTLLRILGGFLEPSEGQVILNGEDICEVPAYKRELNTVFQKYALFPHMNVYDNIAFGLKMRKYDKKYIDEKVKEAAKILNLTEYLDRKPKQLSGGQRQRVALGRAIVRNPKVFLMDEPLSNLDAKLRVQMRAEIKKLHEKLQTTFIYVTHDQTEALTMGDRIVVLDKGKIQQVDTPTNIYNNPQNKFVAGFIGSPQMNFIDCNIINNTLIMTEPIIELSRDIMEKLHNRHYVTIGIRPENMTNPNGRIKLNVKVEMTELLGSEQIAYFNIGENRCSAKLSAEQNIGEYLELSLDSNEFLYFDQKTGERIL